MQLWPTKTNQLLKLNMVQTAFYSIKLLTSLTIKAKLIIIKSLKMKSSQIRNRKKIWKKWMSSKSKKIFSLKNLKKYLKSILQLRDQLKFFKVEIAAYKSILTLIYQHKIWNKWLEKVISSQWKCLWTQKLMPMLISKLYQICIQRKLLDEHQLTMMY